MNYKFGTKNNWRRACWNSIVNKLGVPVSEAIVLYLAAEGDEDRSVAVSKGFRRENLIAVDRDEKVVSALRARGIPAIHCDIFVLATIWPESPRLSAVHADLVCGLFNSIIQYTVVCPFILDCVWAINLMRGRDKETNDSRETAIRLFKSVPREKIAASGIHDAVLARHRGAILWTLAFSSWAFSQHHVRGKMAIGEMLDKNRPRLLTYRSVTNQTFDSVIFRPHTGISEAEQARGREIMREEFRDHPVMKSIRAICAHRTRGTFVAAGETRLRSASQRLSGEKGNS